MGAYSICISQEPHTGRDAEGDGGEKPSASHKNDYTFLSRDKSQTLSIWVLLKARYIGTTEYDCQSLENRD